MKFIRVRKDDPDNIHYLVRDQGDTAGAVVKMRGARERQKWWAYRNGILIGKYHSRQFAAEKLMEDFESEFLA